MKTLYFEGAGSPNTVEGDITNCRIRTAFTNNDGKKIYLELLGHKTEAGWVDTCFYITEENNLSNDCNLNRIKSEIPFEYNQKNILKLVNSLGCNFEAVQVLPDLAGYRVFKKDNVYNYGDKFKYDEELTIRRTLIYNHYYELEKKEGKKYPNFSLWVDDEDKNILHLLRHFNGYNKQWKIIVLPQWEATEELLDR